MSRRHYRVWTAKERAMVVLHYGPAAREPWPTHRIAAGLGRSQDDVRSAARRWRLTSRKLTLTASAAVARRLLDLYREGLDDGWIALLVGCDRNTVARWRKREGLPPLKWGYGRPLPALPRPPIGRNDKSHRRAAPCPD